MPEREGWTLIVDWSDGSFADARAAVDAALSAYGVDPTLVDPDDINIDIGSYRGSNQPASPYYRAFVRNTVLGPRDA